MNFINLEDFKKTESYETFIQENPSTGKLKIEVFTAYRAIPIPDTRILITKDIDGQKASGMISDIELPAPIENKNFKPGDEAQYTMYDVTAIHEGYERIKRYDVAIFGNIGVIQYIKMIPEIKMEGIEQNGS